MLPNMELPSGFQFSQGSLQDFVDCRRRFQLRYIQNLAWPALPSQPALESEQALQRGIFFHRLIHQHLLGVPTTRLAASIHDDVLVRWWKNFLTHDDWRSGSTLYPEISLSGPLEEYRLIAKYDLVLVGEGGDLTIVDWKTSRKRPKHQWLRERMQSRVYPYLMANSGSQFSNSNLLHPEMIEMIYWFAEFPNNPERFPYTSSRFQEDQAFLTKLIREIVELEPEEFPLTSSVEQCAYCVYRSYCNRGVKAGLLEELEDSLENIIGEEYQLDLEEIGEIEY